jgi:hypothetical protein
MQEYPNTAQIIGYTIGLVGGLFITMGAIREKKEKGPPLPDNNQTPFKE